MASAGAATESLLGQLNGAVAKLKRILPHIEREAGTSSLIGYLGAGNNEWQ
jgi:hypothetical protein